MSCLRVQEPLVFVRSRIHTCVAIGASLGSVLVTQACGGEVTTSNQGSGTSAPKCAAVEADGSIPQYVLSVTQRALSDGPLFIFDAILNVDAGEMCMTIRPLAAADRTTPVGPPEHGGPYALADSGLFVAHYALVIPADANPGFPSMMDVPADFQLEAHEPTCGSVAGCYYPVGPGCYDFSGSTFALTPISDPDAHARPILDCAGTRAYPL